MDAETNDKLRQSIPQISPPNLLAVTCGVSALRGREVAHILQKVKKFDDFNEDNDPYGEHDFGSFDHNNRKIFWKIDDYNGKEGYNLVLTVLLAEEY